MKLTSLNPIILTLTLVEPLVVEAQSLQARSGNTNGLYVVIATPHGIDQPLWSSDKIIYGASTVSNGIQRLRIPRVEYLCRVELNDVEGRPVPATKDGKKMGSRFEHLMKDITEKKRVSERPMIAQLQGSQGQELPSPNVLFKIERPGRYTLKLTFQLIVITGLPARADYSVIRFSPLSYPVEKK